MRLSLLASAAILIAFAAMPLFAAVSDGSQLNQASLSVFSESASGISVNFSPSLESVDALVNGLRDDALPGDVSWIHGWVILPPTGGVEVKTSNIELTQPDGKPADAQIVSPGMINSLARIGKPVVFRGVRMASLSTATSVLEGSDRLIVRNADVEIVFTPGRGVAEVAHPPLQISERWHSFLESVVLNPLSPNLPQRDLARTNSGKMLILRPSAIEDQAALRELDRFAEWKRQTGLEVTLEAVDIGNTSPQQIRNRIAEGYPDDPYDFALLIGWDMSFDGDILLDPPIEYSENLLFPSFWLDEEQADTGDYLYGALDDLDGLDDWMPDVMVGRMMVQDEATLRGALNRSIMYEQDPYVGVEGHEGEWFGHAFVVSDAAADTVRVPFVDKEMGTWVMNGLQRIGMNVDTLYTNQTDAFVLERDMLQDVGASVVIVEGYLMGASSFDDSDYYPYDQGMNPLVVANSLWYGHPKCYQYFSSDGFPERSGPIAWISSAAYTNTSLDRRLNGGVVRALTQQRTNQVGDLYFSGIMESLTWEPFLAERDFRLFMRRFMLTGDPSVQVYTATPVVLQTNLPETIPTGATALNIRVTNADGQDVPGAKVCIRQPDRFQYVTETDGGGEVSFTIPEGIEEGTLQVTVTKVNCRAVVEAVDVAGGDVNLAITGYELDDTQNGGDSDHLLDNGETAALSVTFVNNGIGENGSTGVEAHLSANSPYVTFNRDIVGVDDMDSGGGSGTFSEPVTITLDPDCPGLTEIAVQIRLTAEQGSWLGGFELISSGPRYETNPDEIGAEGLRPGADDATLNPRLYNTGDHDGSALNVVLVSLSEGVEVTWANRQCQAIAAGSSNTADDLFHVRVNRYFAPGTIANFALLVGGGNNANYTSRFNVPVGVSGEGDPVGPDDYGYLAFDSGDTTWPQAPTYEWLEINPDAAGGGDVRGTRLHLTDISNWSDGAEESGESKTIDLPFTFPFYGQDYDKLVVCTNGWVSFDTNAVFFRSPFNRAFPGMATPDAQIALCWQDLRTSLSPFDDIYTYYLEDAGAFIVEWSGYNIFSWEMVENDTGGFDKQPLDVPVQFQLRLYDPEIKPTPSGDGEAVIQYKQYTHSPGYFDNQGFPYAAVGIRNADGTDGLQYLYSGHYDRTAGAIGNEFAIKFTTRLQHETGTVIGRIVLAEDPNNGIAGVHISHPLGIDFTTAADGRFSIELPVGTYNNMRFELPYHNRIEASFTIREGQQINLGDMQLTHPELVRPGEQFFDLQPGYPTDRAIPLRNTGNGALEFHAKIINADSTEPNLEMLSYVPLSAILREHTLNAPAYRLDTDSLYVPVKGNPHTIRVVGLDGGRGRIIPQPYTPDGADSSSSDGGLNYLTWDGEHFWGTLSLNDNTLRAVEFTDAGAIVRSFVIPFESTGSVPIVYVPERGTLFLTYANERIWEVSIAEDHLGEMLNSWSIEVSGEAFTPIGIGWNPRDVDQHPLYVVNWNSEDSPNNRIPRRLIRLNLETGDYKTWANLAGNGNRRVKGMAFIPNYDATHMAIAGIDQIPNSNPAGYDTLRYYNVGPRTDYLIGGLQLTAGSVPGGTTRHIIMHFDATGLAEGDYSFAIKINHNAIGDSVIVPVRMIVDDSSSVGDDPIIPIEFGIAKAFPNPFNSDLAVRFVAPVGVEASLKVFDLAGREVGTLYSGRSYGSSRVVWQAGNLPSGIYIVRLEAGGRVDQLKAALIK